MTTRPGRSPANRYPRQVNVLKDTELTLPGLYLEVFLAGENRHEDAMLAEMFLRASCSRADTPENADLVVFGGGSDVNPAYYGEDPHCLTSFNVARDDADVDLFGRCREIGVPMFGICRGAQFLHVMNGGKLYQDLDGHTGTHSIWDATTGRQVDHVSSVHHQACVKSHDEQFVLLADANKSTVRWLNDKLSETKGGFREVEAYFWKDTCCLGVQGHPEYRGYYNYLQWTLKLIEKWIVNGPETGLINGKTRIRDSVRNQRLEKDSARMKEMN